MFLNFHGVKISLAGSAWKLHVPLNIKLFIWLALRNKILTKEVLVHRGWPGSLSCCFCSSTETMDHLFVSYDISFTFWSKFNCYNTRGIFLIIDTLNNLSHSTICLSADNRKYAQSLISIFF
jgi:zinc-binding in reverse transcriptase